MSNAYRRRPSAGFILLLLALLGVVLFFAWGLATPRLDEVWRLAIQLRLGERPALSGSEFRHLQDALVDHPELADYLAQNDHAGILSAHEDGRVEGAYAYLVRRAPTDPGHLEVVFAGSEQRGWVEVRARTALDSEQGRAVPGTAFSWTLPDGEPFPQLVEILLRSGDVERNGKKRRHAVRVDLRGER